jgi:exopolyphosphatase/guanosine-5'-triphosphate,3'-diphosphate pyrophosphatase
MDSFGIRKDLKGKIAVIDIGSNTLLCMIAECRSGKMEIIEDHIMIARLGEGLSESGSISYKSLERAEAIVKNYIKLIEKHEADSIIAVATAAIREAKNGEEIKQKLEQLLNTRIMILPSESEAALSYYGTFGSNMHGNLIDIGGGSTEFATINNGEGKGRLEKISVPIGAVKIKEMFLHNDPAEKDQISNARAYIQESFNSFAVPRHADNINAVAGTPVTIASIKLGIAGYDFDKIHGYTMTSDELDQIIKRISQLNSSELRDILHVHPHRCDIIVAGGLILDEYIKFASAESFTVNCLGLRFGPLAVPRQTKEYDLLF